MSLSVYKDSRIVTAMGTRQNYTNFYRKLILIGIAFAVIGSFLPWEVEGDFLSYWKYGVQLFPVFEDNGGVLILLLSIIIVGLISRADQSRHALVYVTICAAFLSVVSVYHVTDWLFRRISLPGAIGAPQIQIGLILVGIGSLLTLITILVVNFKVATSK
jgi:hypothetical protein